MTVNLAPLLEKLRLACDRPDKVAHARASIEALIERVQTMPDPNIGRIQVLVKNDLYSDIVASRPREARVVRVHCDKWTELDARDFAWLKTAVDETQGHYHPYTLETRPTGTPIEPSDTRQYFTGY